MSKKKKKYYVVWEGNNIGVFNTWDECKLQTKNYKGAKYKSFENKEEAEAAYSVSYYDFMNNKPKKDNSDPPNYNSISVSDISS